MLLLMWLKLVIDHSYNENTFKSKEEDMLTNIGTITVQVTDQDGNTYGVHE